MRAFILILLLLSSCFKPEEPPFITEETANHLNKKLKLDDPYAKMEAAEEIMKYGKRAVSTLVELSKNIYNPDPRVRKYSLAAIKSMGVEAQSITPKVIELLKDENPEIVKAAVETLFALGPKAKEDYKTYVEGKLKILSKNGNYKERLKAAQFFSSLGPYLSPQIEDLITIFKKEEQPDVKLKIIEAFGNSKNFATTLTLAELLTPSSYYFKVDPKVLFKMKYINFIVYYLDQREPFPAISQSTTQEKFNLIRDSEDLNSHLVIKYEDLFLKNQFDSFKPFFTSKGTPKIRLKKNVKLMDLLFVKKWDGKTYQMIEPELLPDLKKYIYPNNQKIPSEGDYITKYRSIQIAAAKALKQIGNPLGIQYADRFLNKIDIHNDTENTSSTETDAPQ